MLHVKQWRDTQDFFNTRTRSVIAGDIGGTKSRLQWTAQAAGRPLRILFERWYDSAQFADAVLLLRQFMADAGREGAVPDLLCLALPGPVESRRVVLTNLDWVVDAEALGRDLAISDVRFINDFQAAAAGVSTLHKTDYQVINPGLILLGATRVVTGAGTGLGVAWMQADHQGDYQTFASEGGHIDFAPINAQQCNALHWLQQRHGHVSWERVLSGAGLAALYEFVLESVPGQVPAPPLDAARIHAAALRNEPAALAAVQLFADIYAAWIGNLALLYRPQGGLYVAGGIAIHLRAWIEDARFLQIAGDKGRMAKLVQNTPVYLVTNPGLGLSGAMRIATS